MEVRIRKALKEDCDAIMMLVKELAIYEKAAEEVTVTMEHFMESGFGENPVWEAFVAVVASPNHFEGGEQAKMEANVGIATNTSLQSSTFPSPSGRIGGAISTSLGGAVIGFALYYTRYSTWKGQRMYLEDLLVTETMRGKNVGKLLFDALITECKEKKYSGLVWQVLDWNEPAINFYKKYEGVKFENEWLNCSIGF